MLVKTGTGMADSSGAGSSPPAREPSRLPRDAQLVISLLHQMGIQDWEPRVINQLLEYTFRESPVALFPCFPWSCCGCARPHAGRVLSSYRGSAGYVSEVGHDAEMYKRHAGKQQLDADDIRVAIKLEDTQIMRPPDRDVCRLLLAPPLALETTP